MDDEHNNLKKHFLNIETAVLESWQHQYSENCAVIMNDIVPEFYLNKMLDEAQNLLELYSFRRELFISESGNTPRSYESVGRDNIRKYGQWIPLLFDSPDFHQLLSIIANEQLHPVPYLPEEFIINSQSHPKDTHGWHWDDYAFALIWCVAEPDPLDGARVEYIPNIPWKKQNTESYLKETLRSNPVRSLHIKKGDCYLMKANTSLHRVSPLTKFSKRTVIVMTFASTSDLSDASITHGSMEEIYPDETEIPVT